MLADWPGEGQPEALAGKSVAQIADHLAATVKALGQKPVLIGHSFGGLFTQMLAGKGLAAVSVAIDPAPFRGVLPLPFSALKAAFPVLSNPANRGKTVMLTFAQFRYAFANAVSEAEARDLYATYVVPTPGKPLFQAALANVNPGSELAVDTANPERGPLLIIEGDHDHIVPASMANAAYRRQRRNPSVTEIAMIPGRGHSLVIDSGWKQVAETALAFVRRFV